MKKLFVVAIAIAAVMVNALPVAAEVAEDITLSDDNNVAGSTITLTVGDRLLVPDPAQGMKRCNILPRINVTGDAVLVLPAKDDCNTVLLSGGIEAADNVRLTIEGCGISVTNNTTEPLIFDSSCELTFSANGTISVKPFSDGFSATIPDGETVIMNPSVLATNWHKKVALWFDASVAESIGLYPDAENPETKGDYPLIMSWHDRRGADFSDNYLFNGRSFIQDKYPITLNSSDRHPEVYPFVVTNGLNDLAYVSMGVYNDASQGKRRLMMTSANKVAESGVTWAASSSQSAAYAILVFGSQNGGGDAIFGTTTSGLKRSSHDKDSPFFGEEADFAMFTNGVETTGNTATPNGDWQILSVDFDTTQKIDSFGTIKGDAYGNCGGQNYAEVLLFSEKPTDDERKACEMYLAQKWGLPLPENYASTGHVAKPGEIIPPVNLHGRGSVTLAANAEIQGGFQGSINVSSDAKMIVAHNAPPGEEAVPSEGRILWLDPDFSGSVALTVKLHDENDKRINFLYPRTETEIETSHAMRGADGRPGADRCPWTNRVARGYGPERTWLEFSNFDTSIDTSGNTLRYQNPIVESKHTYDPIGDTNGDDVEDKIVHEGFMVLDTSLGGGTPIGVNVGMYETHRGLGTNYLDPIWPAENRRPATRLDNVPVGTSDGFNGRPEVFSFTFKVAWPAAFFGAYSDGNKEMSEGGREIIGESVFFSRQLEDSERASLAAYLAYKWFGKVLPGYSELSQMTISGSGNINVSAGSKVPKVSDDFTGTLDFTDGEFSFTLNTRSTPQVAEAIVVPCDVKLPKDCVIRVNCEETQKPKAGLYPLITAKSLTGCENCTLIFTPAADDVKTRILVNDDTICLSVGGQGAIIIVR